jgi:hypothetical protein
MAKTGRKSAGSGNGDKGESISGYFRKVFRENPKLLKQRSNDELLHRWSVDHPGEQVTNRIKQNLANLKSILRKKGRRRKGKKAAEPVETAAVLVFSAKKTYRGLEALELEIDDCLTSARGLDREGLEDVINFLRRARNAVVWKLGQKE